MIGKRVPDAMVMQPDMELVGVADFAGSTPTAVVEQTEAGSVPAGGLRDLLERADVIRRRRSETGRAASKAA